MNVVPLESTSVERVRDAINRFRADDPQPLIIGDGATPEAALIPFTAFVRLMRHDYAAHVRGEDAFQRQLLRRIKDSDARRERGEAGTELAGDEQFDAWVEASFGEIGRNWVRDRQSREEGADGA